MEKNYFNYTKKLDNENKMPANVTIKETKISKIVRIAVNFGFRKVNMFFSVIGIAGFICFPLGAIIWLFLWSSGWKFLILGVVLIFSNWFYKKVNEITIEAIRERILSDPQYTKIFLEKLKTNEKFMKQYFYLFDEEK